MVQVLEVVAGARGDDPIELAKQIHGTTTSVFFPQ
jgi:hypothetical protein